MQEYGFTDTEPWSEKLKWLGYDSSNYFALLGSIGLFFFGLGMQGFISFVFDKFKLPCISKRVRDYFKMTEYKRKQVRFFMEAIFELMICGFAGYKQLAV